MGGEGTFIRFFFLFSIFFYFEVERAVGARRAEKKKRERKEEKGEARLSFISFPKESSCTYLALRSC